MSISSALNSAGSGLLATARAVQVASSNVANGMTPGYSPRQVNLAAAAIGGTGVRVTGIARHVDPVLQGLIRDATSASAGAETRARLWSSLEPMIGLPGEPGSLSALLDNFETALIDAADRPDLDSRLAQVVRDADMLVGKLASLEDEIQNQRLIADAAIAADVRTLNEGLERLHRYNLDMARLQASGQPVEALEDERDALLLSLSEIVPLSARYNADGKLSLYTKSGLSLLDLKPQRLEFEPVPAMSAGMSLELGHLSGLTMNGIDLSTSLHGPLGGGRLAASFAIRDSEAQEAQAKLDGLAGNLILRFESQDADPTRPAGTPGLFTDAGSPLGNAAPDPGLAGRLLLNPDVVPSEGGDLWRLRDGLGSPQPGPVGQNEQIIRLLQVMDQPFSSEPGSPARSISGEFAAFLSGLGQESATAAERAIVTSTILSAHNQQHLQNGVDIDAEMQRLLYLETAYAANARVIRVADEMLQRILEI